MKRPIYLDYAATTPCDPEVLEEILPFFYKSYGNPSNITHFYGKEASQAVEISRYYLASHLNCKVQQIIWTSGATEANNIAIQGALSLYKRKSNNKIHIITSSIEHKSVLETCLRQKNGNVEVTCIKPDSNGQILSKDINEQVRDNTVLVSIMLANNETGVINDLRAISNICSNRGILLHTDATQYVGKEIVNLNELRVDFLSLSGHKMYAPKGVGALFVRDFSTLDPIMFGGNHEQGYRSGTLNVPCIVGIGKACQIIQEEIKNDFERICKLRDRLESLLMNFDNRIIINGFNAPRVSNISSLSFPVRQGRNIINEINGIACSSGSACDTPDNKPSHVMMSLGKSNHQAKNTLRISLGRFTTELEINETFNILADTLNEISEKRI